MSKTYTKLGRYIVEHSGTYYLCYAGGKRDLTNDQLKAWNKTKSIPNFQLRLKEQAKLGLNNNPNVIPVKGIQLLEFMRDLNFTPMFDPAFNVTHTCQLADPVTFEAIKQKNYEKAIGKW